MRTKKTTTLILVEYARLIRLCHFDNNLYLAINGVPGVMQLLSK